MINIEELRLGNRVAINDLMGVVVSMSSPVYEKCINNNTKPIMVFCNGDNYDCSEIDIKPIPLTEELLLECGFEVEYTNGGFLRWQKGKFKLLDRRLPYPMNDIHTEYILYLHQLQNIYYYLTGKELLKNN